MHNIISWQGLNWNKYDDILLLQTYFDGIGFIKNKPSNSLRTIHRDEKKKWHQKVVLISKSTDIIYAMS